MQNNSFGLQEKYLPVLDEVYKSSSLTAVMDHTVVDYGGGNAVKVFLTELNGLGDYDRNIGFSTGSVTGTWQSLELTQDRARSFLVDRMDNEEMLDQAFGTLAGEFIRTKVVPELDAYRFAAYASASGIGTVAGATLSNTTIVSAIDAAVEEMDNNEVPFEDRILYITPANYTLLKKATSDARFAVADGVNFNTNFETYDGMRLIKVPQSRFYTAVSLMSGSGSEAAGGFSKTSGAKDINFMLIHPSAVLQVPKHTMPRIFSPEENQSADAWKFDYRIYHDAFVYPNKVKGIYLHKRA